jgi:simple sugar transport system ATP-binding protein
MDEPTSVLTPQAVEQLFDTLRALAREGTAILYVSHKLDEIRRLCDRATILRGGHNAGEVDPRAESEAHLAELMIGRSFPRTQKRAHARGAAGLQVSELSLPPDGPFGVALHSVSLSVHRGEVLGIAGISGNGQRNFWRQFPADAGWFSGRNPPRETPVGHLDAGRAAAWGSPTCRRSGWGAARCRHEPRGECAAHGQPQGHGARRAGRLARGEAYAARCIREFDVRAGAACRGARALRRQPAEVHRRARSRGARRDGPRAARPGRGRGRDALIRQRILDLAAAGVAVLVVSEDLGEILEVCDRVAVMAGGRLSPVREVGETHAAEIGAWMAGGFLR